MPTCDGRVFWSLEPDEALWEYKYTETYTYSWHILDNFGDIKHKAHVILEKKQLPIDNESIRQSVHNRETGSNSNWHQRNTLYMRDL